MFLLILVLYLIILCATLAWIIESSKSYDIWDVLMLSIFWPFTITVWFFRRLFRTMKKESDEW